MIRESEKERIKNEIWKSFKDNKIENFAETLTYNELIKHARIGNEIYETIPDRKQRFAFLDFMINCRLQDDPYYKVV